MSTKRKKTQDKGKRIQQKRQKNKHEEKKSWQTTLLNF